MLLLGCQCLESESSLGDLVLLLGCQSIEFESSLGDVVGMSVSRV